ncbi:hypothetical protein [Nonomuraea sp. B19D2]|uniref:hypothetical protein n=1 Tax=Nonomuraea sp. B19D2 TaxID=3159561 RepID=UPI0032DA68B3
MTQTTDTAEPQVILYEAWDAGLDWELELAEAVLGNERNSLTREQAAHILAEADRLVARVDEGLAAMRAILNQTPWGRS